MVGVSLVNDAPISLSTAAWMSIVTSSGRPQRAEPMVQPNEQWIGIDFGPPRKFACIQVVGPANSA